MKPRPWDAGKPPSPLADDAVAGVGDAGLRKLLEDHWEHEMMRSPVWATTLGDHRYDSHLGDQSAEGVAKDRAANRDLLARARALPRVSMSRDDQITLDLLIGELDGRRASEVCDTHLWSVSVQDNAISDFNELPEMHRPVKHYDGASLVSRYRAIPRAVDDQIDNLREGMRRGLVAEAETARRALELIDGQLAQPLTEWVLLRPASEQHADWTAEQREQFAADLRATVEHDIVPAYRRYRKVVAEEVLPAARGADKAGVGHLPSGAACYAAMTLKHTAMPLLPDDLHKIGLDEIARINAEMIQLGEKLFPRRILRNPKDPLGPVLNLLRTDRALYFETEAEIVAAAQAALAGAKARIPDFFGRLPRADCVVVPIPAYEAPFTTIAYYREPHFGGSKPGEYFINTFKPELRPRFEMQVLAYHESIPGHHLQIALSQEQSALPAFRRFLGSTAFVEGWALYTERLAAEMGLYAGDLDRMGMLSYDAWRAARLVVDTGLHAKGWTRAQAEAFMREHTALTPVNIANEVDRYIAWPGQALAYKVGQLEILRLRAEAQAALGPRFDIKRFHDVVLGSGAVTLPVLRDNVQTWMAQEGEKAKP